ncbi:uncharacterized protein LOC123557168 [Mercenaria mercenaria]|uniref:uncharacterized protein LOC123557168 n=1 Tax=Mercenaria mercenaria TaxID=6596 RepID=UPI00234F6129|nr:uncharacterized protein LOC123557168 [Mercenaria mercenaria]
MIENTRPATNLLVFPQAKDNNFTLTMPNVIDQYQHSPALPNKISSMSYHQLPRATGVPNSNILGQNKNVHQSEQWRLIETQSPVHFGSTPYSRTDDNYVRIRPFPYLKNETSNNDPHLKPRDNTSEGTPSSIIVSIPSYSYSKAVTPNIQQEKPRTSFIMTQMNTEIENQHLINESFSSHALSLESRPTLNEAQNMSLNHADGVFIKQTPEDALSSGRTTVNDVTLPEIFSPNEEDTLSPPFTFHAKNNMNGFDTIPPRKEVHLQGDTQETEIYRDISLI